MCRSRSQSISRQVLWTFFAMDALKQLGTAMFDDAMMAQKLPSAVVQRFNQCLITGEPTPEDDQKAEHTRSPRCEAQTPSKMQQNGREQQGERWKQVEIEANPIPFGHPGLVRSLPTPSSLGPASPSAIQGS